MWQSQIRSLADDRIHHYTILKGETALTFAEVLAFWRDDGLFRRFFSSLLADSTFRAYRWETPCVTSGTLHRQFQFVLLEANSLERSVDRKAFAEHFDNSRMVVTFPNLGRNATLVVPCPVTDDVNYAHLAVFTRNAPETQLHEFWREVSTAMLQRVGNRPVWLSTAGMGVSWLHVRLDNRPKYYGYAPFRSEVE